MNPRLSSAARSAHSGCQVGDLMVPSGTPRSRGPLHPSGTSPWPDKPGVNRQPGRWSSIARSGVDQAVRTASSCQIGIITCPSSSVVRLANPEVSTPSPWIIRTLAPSWAARGGVRRFQPFDRPAAPDGLPQVVRADQVLVGEDALHPGREAQQVQPCPGPRSPHQGGDVPMPLLLRQAVVERAVQHRVEAAFVPVEFGDVERDVDALSPQPWTWPLAPPARLNRRR